MSRRQHIIKPNKGCEQPQNAIWTDTETNPVKLTELSERHELKLGFASVSRTVRPHEWTNPKWLRYTTIPEFWDWVEAQLRPKIKLYVFAHNWAFDFPVLDGFTQLPARGFELVGSVIQSPPIILKYRRGNQTLMFVDTLNIWRIPLKVLGASLGLEKLTMPATDASIKEWDIYAKRDVEIIMLACQQWWRFLTDNDLGGFAATLAAQAFRTFRHKFMEHEILIDDNDRALALSRQALHGGRTECFYIGKVPERMYKLDVNSMYPAVMQKELMPTRLIGHYNNVSMSEIQNWITKYLLVVKCRVRTTLPIYPVVHADKLIFPVGEFETYLTTPEIMHAIAAGDLVMVSECAVYEHAVIFKKYVDWFYAYRRECIDAGQAVSAANAKLFLTNLYGKFGQRGFIYDIVDRVDDNSIKLWKEIDAETGDIFEFRQYGGIVEQLIKETESRESHPAIAAHVTAHARMMLWSLLNRAGLENVFYCDTDSVWCNERGYNKLRFALDETQLGKLKLEGIHDTVTIYGPKDYNVDGDIRIKGIKKNAKRLREGLYQQVKFTTLKGLLRAGDLTAPVVTTITKQLRRQYNKGIVQPDGRVLPLTFPLE